MTDPSTPPRMTEELIRIATSPIVLAASLVLPADARGIVLFAHGSGSSRFSPRNRYVARRLNEARLATLLADLLTTEEEMADAQGALLRFDIDLLAGRLIGATDWLRERPDTRHLPIGYFGASTGAAAALAAAAARADVVRAIVSRGGRPDLAGSALALVQAPTLLIVGSNDPDVLDLNRRSLAELRVEKRLEIVPGAAHLFEEPGALEEVSRLAREWFERHLIAAKTRAA